MRNGDDLLRFLYKALIGADLVLITLKNRKFYIGYVASLPNISPSGTYLRLLPILSGYREQESLSLHFTADYVKPLREDEVEPEMLVVTMPMDEILTTSLFRPDLYRKFELEDKPDKPHGVA
jgi:hypothetical protein